MAKQVQFRRGTTAQLSSVTGVEGELFVDTTKDTLTVHDGYQAGGFPLLREDLDNLANGVITPAMLANGTANQLLRTNAAGNGVEWFTQDLAGRLLDVVALGPGASLSGDDAVHNHADRNGTSGTWTRPAGCNNVLVYVTGAGGGSQIDDNSYRNASGGGGGTAIKWIENVAATVNWTVGTGGLHSTGTQAGNGGASTFGSYCTGYGGWGGRDGTGGSQDYGSRGGGASGGDLNIPGGGGAFSHGSNSENQGGMSFWTQAGSSHRSGNSCAIRFASHGRLGAGSGQGYYSQENRNLFNGGAGIILLYAYS